MAIIKAQDGTSDPIITRMVAEDKVLERYLLTQACTNGSQGTMVQETQPPLHVPLAFLVLYGSGDDLWFRLTTDWNTAILSAIQQM